MAKGEYRYKDGWVMVDYGASRIPIPRDQYVDQGFQPPYDELLTQEQYTDIHHQKAFQTFLDNDRDG
jgi:hypothetical protein